MLKFHEKNEIFHIKLWWERKNAQKQRKNHGNHRQRRELATYMREIHSITKASTEKKIFSLANREKLGYPPWIFFFFPFSLSLLSLPWKFENFWFFFFYFSILYQLVMIFMFLSWQKYILKKKYSKWSDCNSWTFTKIYLQTFFFISSSSLSFHLIPIAITFFLPFVNEFFFRFFFVN